ncbi:type I CRISPR-associated protein Cas7 [uncultured Ilyobacter sp.]|uniref:type I CRISPR-associated protein Cas7 n=1 Tax=uncultured Ilyobacter sp. TaxID=544433 RepID=UPI002AA73D87|nr:type I CRISPR-associated protein Cas7 [uncultured Ilyobacter sp.]
MIKNNSDFIYFCEAKQTNPNGDPDRENRPRMDTATKTNLVTKYRKKRNVRDYRKFKHDDIFVDTIDDKKVAVETKLKAIFLDSFEKKDIQELLKKNDYLRECSKCTKIIDIKELYSFLNEILKKKKSDINEEEKKLIKEIDIKKFNNELLTEIIKKSLYDIRLFGGAFAVEGFTRTFTGPVQINWGYSLHPVDEMKSNSLVTIMNDDSSTFGKNFNVEYSFLAFNGTISKYTAKSTGMTESDKEFFREAMVMGDLSNRTSSKSVEPVVYLEIEYKEGFHGFLGDLRNLLEVNFEIGKPIRNYNDIEVRAEKLVDKLVQFENIIQKIHLWENPIKEYRIFDMLRTNEKLKNKIKPLFFFKV